MANMLWSTSNIIYRKYYIYLKIKALGDTRWSYLGVDNANAQHIDDNFSDSRYEPMYAYRPSDGSFYSWNGYNIYNKLPRFKKGDILTIKLQFEKDVVIFSVQINDGNEVVAITDEKNINLDDKYRLAIATSNVDASYQIIN